jgi:hypothetical protein
MATSIRFLLPPGMRKLLLASTFAFHVTSLFYRQLSYNA